MGEKGINIVRQADSRDPGRRGEGIIGPVVHQAKAWSYFWSFDESNCRQKPAPAFRLFPCRRIWRLAVEAISGVKPAPAFRLVTRVPPPYPRRTGRQATSLVLMITISILLFTGCEKVIDVELNEASPAIVIEGNLSFNDSELNVKITKTGNYFDATPPVAVDQAEVFLEERTGMKRRVRLMGEGRYGLSGLHLNPGSTYRLHVTAEGRTYTAASTLHPPVRIDSLTYDYTSETRFIEGGYRLMVYFSDPIGREDFYRIRVHKNGEVLNELDDLIVFDDSELDGRIIQVRLRRQAFDMGDTARVDLLTIDKNAWLYYSTLRNMADLNPGSPAPANPVSNFNNGALGYFSAWSGSSKTTFIGEKQP